MRNDQFVNEEKNRATKAEIVFLRILIPFTLGILMFYNLTSTILLYWIGLSLLTIFLYLIFINLFYKTLRAYRFKGFIGLALYIFLFLFGALMCFSNKQSLNANYYAGKQQDYLKICINDEPQFKGQILRFRAIVTRSYRLDGSRLPKSEFSNGKLMVAVKIDSLKPPSLKYGDELIIPAKFTGVEPPYNPAEFDYKSWLATQNIYHQIFLKQQQLVKLNGNNGSRIIAIALKLRAKQVLFYRKLLKDDDAFAMASTLILGYRADLSVETLSIFSRTGTIHALSVSGMHVGLIYFVLNWALQFLNRWRLLKIIKIVVILILIWFYALLTGFSPSVLRSGIMLSVFIIAQLFNRHTNSYNIVAFAAFCLLIYDPFLIWDVGFQLSFLAVTGLIYLQPKIQNWCFFENKWLNKLWGIVAMSLAAQLFTYPLSIYYFHQFPIYFLFSNLFIMVPVALLMYLGIVILLGRFEFLAPGFEWLINFTNSGLKWISNLPFSSLSAIWINKIELFILCISLIFLVLALSNFKKRLLLISLLCLAIFQSLLSYDKVKALHQKKIIVFNLRKNHATAFISAQKAILFTDIPSDGSAFKYFIQPALDFYKIKEVSCINGDRDTILFHFKLKNEQITFYNYQVNEILLRNCDLKKNKAYQVDLKNIP